MFADWRSTSRAAEDITLAPAELRISQKTSRAHKHQERRQAAKISKAEQDKQSRQAPGKKTSRDKQSSVDQH